MRNFICIIAAMILSFNVQAGSGCSDLLETQAIPIGGGKPVDFCKLYKGKVLLIVNTASQCGYTGQLKSLEKLYETYKDRGLVVLAFPSNDFHQEYDSAKETEKLAREKYGVSFPIFESSSVSGAAANPFFSKLIKASGKEPQWNFQKYLIDRQGQLQKVYPSSMDPENPLFQLEIEGLLKQP